MARSRSLIFIAVTAAIASASAHAATYTIQVGSDLTLGTVSTSATGDTIFRADPATGGVTAVSGTGRRVSGGAARALVTVSCKPGAGGDPKCKDDNIPIRITAIGSVSGRARALTNFKVSMGTATLAAPPTGAAPLTFQIGPVGNNGSKTFYVGADFPVAGDDSGLPSGVGRNSFDVSIDSPIEEISRAAVVAAGGGGQGQVTALRPLAVTKRTDMNFGLIQRPLAGASLVTAEASAKVGAGGANISAGIPGAGAAVAFFDVTGEGGQQISVNVPPSMVISGPGTITVTLHSLATPAPTLSGTLGSGGTYSFGVGGSLTVTSTTPTGFYSGVFTVSIDYN